MSSTDGNNNIHILVFPYPAEGHMLAHLDLTHQLARENLTITVLVTPNNLSFLTPLLTAHPNIQTLVLPFPSHPSIPPGVENVKELGNTGNVAVISALSNLQDPIIQWFHSHPNPPVAIFSDFFLGFTVRLANQLNIIRIAFFSVSAILCSTLDYCWQHLDHVKKSLDSVELIDLPRSPVFKKEHLPSVFRLFKESNPDWEIVKDGFIANHSSWGCVFNTFDDLESEYLDYLKTKTRRVFGVGPIGLSGPDSVLDPNETLKWLDGCPDGSVVYVCFGSQKVLKREQIEALALGLEKSGTRFLWAVKTQDDSVPNNGLAGRGLVIKGWAPQIPILNHKAVGGFLSHCGWNSVLEGMVGGVMILCWPMEADQFLNARLLVEDLGVAVRACEGAHTVPDSDELGRVIAEAMSTEFEQVKNRAKELKDKALAAVSSGGSSKRDWDLFIQELRKLQTLF